MSGFVHLHVHSEYSLLDGACRIKELVSAVKNMGQTAVAITDHGVMYGVIDFYKEAKKQGIKPIIGCEVYVSPRRRCDRVHGLDNENRHLVLLCKNETGYRNLIAMVSQAWTEGFYIKPRVDRELLEKYHGGLIALSACLAGEIPRALVNGDYQAAKETALYYNSVFGQGNYYLELQNHNLHDQLMINPDIIRLSQETGIPLVVTNDSHYISKEDAKIHKVLMCIQTNTTVNSPNLLEFGSDEFYLKSEEEMRALFPDIASAADNTVKIAEQCNLDFEFGNTKLPHFDVPDNMDHFEYFKEKCYKGLYKHYGEQPEQSLIDRLEYELSVIKKMGYVDYFLIVHDFVRYAKSKGIPVGPGRGSGAGSIAAYCIGITGIDPIKYNLLFERFLNPERVSMPDFDIDFCYERRQEVIDYVNEKYGEDHVAQIVTFGTMAARLAIRDVARALEIPYNVADKVAKAVPMELGMTLKKALEKSSEFKSAYDSDPKIKELIDTALKLEGMPRHTSKHAAGVVITEKPVSEYVPLAKSDESIVTQFPMTTLEELGLLKMDFLGLRTLTVISDAEKMIKRREPEFSIENISTSDKEVFAMLSSGLTEGVFQFESAGMRNILMQLKPESIEDLIAVISLYRPGPMESIPRYIENRHHPDKIKYDDEKLCSILDVTYGCMVYQEQVMQVFRSLAGYSFGRADIVRRAMSKKKHDVMAKEREIFIHGLTDENGNIEVEGAVRRGTDEAVANKIFDEMASFASYAFNKSHAAAYANVAYQTAFLKCHYPREFMAGLLTSVLENSGKISEYTAECHRIHIDVMPPHVNESFAGFTVTNNYIRFGLLAIKNLGRGVINLLIKEREINGPFRSFYDFCKRMQGRDLNRRALESLIKSGSLDGLGANRRQMLMMADTVLNDIDAVKRKNVDGQIGFFDVDDFGVEDTGPELPNVDELPVKERLAMEKETMGLYLSGHPMEEYRPLAEKIGAASIADIYESVAESDGRYKDSDTVTLLVIVDTVKTKISKNNETMAFVGIEDFTGSAELVVFSSSYAEFLHFLSAGNVISVKARISVREDEEPKFICERIFPAVDAKITAPDEKKKVTAKRAGLYLKIPSMESKELEKAKRVMRIFDGDCAVYIYDESSKKLMKAPANLNVSLNDVLVKELKHILGHNNVAIVN